MRRPVVKASFRALRRGRVGVMMYFVNAKFSGQNGSNRMKVRAYLMVSMFCVSFKSFSRMSDGHSVCTPYCAHSSSR